MIAFIDEHKDRHGIKPIYKQLPIAVSTYYDNKARSSDPDKESNRLLETAKANDLELYAYLKVSA